MANAGPTLEDIERKEIALHVISAADVATTCIGIKNGGSEGNPIARLVIGKRPSCEKVIAFKIGTSLFNHYQISLLKERMDYRGADAYVNINIAVTGLTVIWNFTQL